MREKLLPISLFTLAIAIIIAGNSISNAISHSSSNNQTSNIIDALSFGFQELAESIRPPQVNENTSTETEQSNPDLLYFSDAAAYIGVYGDDLQKIIADKNSGIPYIKLKKDIYVFNKKALDKWMEKSYEIKQ